MDKKLEQLRKNVADTKAAFDAAYAYAYAAKDAADVDWNDIDAWDAAKDAADAAFDAYAVWVKARDELAEYLKEQQDNG